MCWLWHKWSKWTIIFNDYPSPNSLYWRTVQQRKCLRCNKVEMSDELAQP